MLGGANMVDGIVLTFAAYILILLAATFYVGYLQQGVDTEDYQNEFYVGGRDLGILVTLILVAASGISPGTFIGSPGYTWEYGPSYTLAILAQGPFTLYVLGIYGKKMGIISRRIDADSLLDLYIARYESYKPLILLLGLVVIVFTEAYVSTEFTGAARAITAISGLPYTLSMLIFAGIVILYTTLGGLRGTGIIGIVGGIAMTFGTLALLAVSLDSGGEMFSNIASINPDLLIPPRRRDLLVSIRRDMGDVFVWLVRYRPCNSGKSRGELNNNDQAVGRTRCVFGDVLVLRGDHSCRERWESTQSDRDCP